MTEGVVNDSRKSDNANDPTNSDWKEITQVGQEFLADIRQPPYKRLVDSKYHHEHSTGKAGRNGADAGEDAFKQADDPCGDDIALGFGRLYVFS